MSKEQDFGTVRQPLMGEKVIYKFEIELKILNTGSNFVGGGILIIFLRSHTVKSYIDQKLSLLLSNTLILEIFGDFYFTSE